MATRWPTPTAKDWRSRTTGPGSSPWPSVARDGEQDPGRLDNFYVWRRPGQVRREGQDVLRRTQALDERSSRRFLRPSRRSQRPRQGHRAHPRSTRGPDCRGGHADVDDVRTRQEGQAASGPARATKSRDVALQPELREAYAAWLAERPRPPAPALFTSRRGGARMTTDAIDDVISGIVKAAGLDDTSRPRPAAHVRHEDAARGHRHRPGVGVLGHSSLETTRVYVGHRG